MPRETELRETLDRLAVTLMGVSRAEPGETLPRHIRSVANSYAQFQLESLGLYVGGYVFLQPDSRDLFTAFEYLPYCWRDAAHRCYEGLINRMFSVWRSRESIHPTISAEKFRPEFFAYLPHADVPTFPGIHEREQVTRATMGCHYVTSGEIDFFLLGWRLLLRLKEAGFGELELTNKGLKMAVRALSRFPTGEPVWNAMSVQALGPRERDWVLAMESEKGVVSGEDALYPLWNKLLESEVKHCDADTALHGEFQGLGIWSKRGQSQTTRSRRRALAQFAAWHRGRSGASRERAARVDRLGVNAKPNERLAAYVLAALCEMVADNPAGPCSVDTLLAGVSRRVRFPILPYYYWNVVDVQPRAHLVMPVWKSVAGARVPVNVDFRNEEVRETDTSGVAVAGVRPLSALDWALTPGVSSDADGRYGMVQRYLNLFAQPIADREYYGRIKRRAEQVDKLRSDIDALRSELRLANRKIVEERAPPPRGFQLCAVTTSSDDLVEALSELKQQKNIITLGVGGDFVDWISVRGGQLVLVLGDVEGHGLEAALAMAAVRGSYMSSLSAGRPLVEVVDELDRNLNSLTAGKNVTLILVAIDPSGAVEYVNAGHAPAYVFRREASWAEPLETTGLMLMALEPMPGDRTLQKLEDQLLPGDAVILMTDGGIEAKGTSGALLQAQGVFRDIVQAAGRRGGKPNDVVSSICGDIKATTSGVLEDDFSIVVCMLAPPGGLETMSPRAPETAIQADSGP